MLTFKSKGEKVKMNLILGEFIVIFLKFLWNWHRTIKTTEVER